jgi:phosphatidylserine decarboxylase
MKIANGCFNLIKIPLVLAAVSIILSYIAKFLSIPSLDLVFLTMGIIFFLFAILLVIFFRDPDRKIGKDIVAPADGKIINIIETRDNEIGECVVVSTFMNIFDVHVNRAPIDGKVRKICYSPGGHKPAFMKSYQSNERNTILLETNIGYVKIVQIAGVFARRIICYLNKGDKVTKGERIGIVRFGSRVDLYLPKDNVEILVKSASRVKAGVDTIAKIHD